MKILMLHETLTKANSNIKKDFFYFHFNDFIFVITNTNKMKNIKDCVCYWPMPPPFFILLILFIVNACSVCAWYMFFVDQN